MSLQNFLTAFQTVKKELNRPEPRPPEERAQILRQMADLLLRGEKDFYALDPSRDVFSKEFYHEAILAPSARAFQRAADEIKNTEGHFPVGVIGISIESPFFLRLLCERLAPALAAGNGVLLKVRHDWMSLARAFADPFYHVLSDVEETSTLLYQHPGIRALSVFDSGFSADSLGGAAAVIEKKWQIHRGGKSTALVLADADLDLAVEGILRAISEGQGLCSWNISRVIVLDSIEKEFRRRLLEKAAHLSLEFSSVIEQKKRFWVQELKNQGARLADENSPVAFLENVSNCTEAHQQELKAPVVFLMGVKYPHEMQRWVNNVGNALGAQIWGSPEKARKLAGKLEVGRVWINSWIQTDLDLNYGVKSSVFGTFDARVFGGFFSEARIVDGETSKIRQ